jgi:predicted nucleic acid-binding protein
MDRLFLDANVLFSAAYRPESGLVTLWKLNRVILLASSYAIEEAHRNLDDDDQRRRLAQLARKLESVRTLDSRPLEIELPAKDEPILRAALAGHASHLITGDVKHFGRFFGQKIMGILVQSPSQYLKSNPKQPTSTLTY